MTAIVTTLRCNPAHYEPVYSFVAYHLSVGFSHVYIFVDHPSNDDLHSLVTSKFSSSFVTVLVQSIQLTVYQKEKCAVFKELESYLNEVPARQTINAEYAYHIASAQGYKWLLHIDIDELFYLSGDDGDSESSSVENHFNYLDSIGVQSMTYVNHEGVPESFDCEDYFKSVTLFRKHHFSLPFNNSSMLAINFWKQRTTHEQYFLVYDNGKSAVRLGIPGTVPRDVHRWKLPTDDDTVHRTNLMDPRQLKVKQYLKCDEPCILHYVTCGYRWLLDKYNILGRFPNFWFGDRLPIAPSFHLTARDIVLGEGNTESETSSAASNRLNAARFYLTQIMLNCTDTDVTLRDIKQFLQSHSDSDTSDDLLKSALSDNTAVRDQQLRCGVLMRLDRVQSILQFVNGMFVDNSAPVDVEALRSAARSIVATKHIEAGSSSDSADRGLGGVTLSANGEISEMDRLRIISQVAFNFL